MLINAQNLLFPKKSVTKKYFKAKIIKVLPGSIADKLKVEAGSYLLAIDGNPLRDLLDYQFAIYDTEELELLLEAPYGSTLKLDITKKPDADLGLIFESAVFDKVKLCNNKCIFCFVDQQPEGLRESLYIKDDDYRLSYLQGTYITLTNLTNADKKRIEQLRLGPLYVSVHSTNPELRIKIFNNPLAGDIMDKLKWLESLSIPVHTQIVLCPGFNDGLELERTLKDLSSFTNILSAAIVPVGITIYRKDHLIKEFNKNLALQTLGIINNINNTGKRNFAFASDEIYLLAEKPFPKEEFYDDFPQLEDGVGTARLTLNKFNSLKLPTKLEYPRHIGIITASLAARILTPVFEKLSSIHNLTVDILEIDNKFWGTQVTVCGLIVGKDIILKLNSLKTLPPEIFLPSVMLRKFSSEFLDGITIAQIEQQFNVKIHIINNYYSFEEVLTILKQKKRSPGGKDL